MRSVCNFLFVLCLAFTAHAYNAINFSCKNGEQFFLLSINENSNAIEEIALFDGIYSWTAKSAEVDEALNYQAKIIGASKRINEEHKEGVLKFSLPAKRPIELRVVGPSYYGAVTERIPFNFNLSLVLSESATTKNYILNCCGL